MDNKYDDVIDILKQDVDVPEVVLKRKEETYNIIRSESKKKSNRSKKVIAAVIVLCIVTVGALNTNVIAEIGNILFSSKGVQEAVDNNYVQELNNVVMKDKGVQVTVKNIIKDTNMIALVLGVKFDDANLTKYARFLKFERIDIYDKEGKRVPTCYFADGFRINKDTNELDGSIKLHFSKLSSENKLYAISDEDINKLDDITINIAAIDVMADASENIGSDFILPKMSKEEEEQYLRQGVRELKYIEGNWRAKVKLDDKFKNSPKRQYIQSNKVNNIENAVANMYPTETVIDFKCPSNMYSSLGDPVLVDDAGNIYEAILYTEIGTVDQTKARCHGEYGATTFKDTKYLKLILTDTSGKKVEVELKLKK